MTEAETFYDSEELADVLDVVAGDYGEARLHRGVLTDLVTTDTEQGGAINFSDPAAPGIV